MLEKLTRSQKLDFLKDVFAESVVNEGSTNRLIHGELYRLGLITFPVHHENDGYAVIGLNMSKDIGSLTIFYYEGEVTKDTLANVNLMFKVTKGLVPHFQMRVSERDEVFEYISHGHTARNAIAWNHSRIASGLLFKKLQVDLKKYAEELV